MAKYAYAPLSVEDNPRSRRGGGNLPHSDAANRERDDNLVNERMPMCVGVCVLLAIVYVLSRTGGDAAANAAAATPGVPAGATVVGAQGNKNLPPVIKTGAPETAPVVRSGSPAAGGSATAAGVSAGAAVTERSNPQEAAATAATAAADCNCDGLVDPATVDMGALRAAALANSPPNIIECAKAEAGEDQGACHLPSKKRFSALGQKGATLWMTGCSGAGKTTIATALESTLVKKYGKHVYRLDGDNLRTGLNRDLTFTEADRAESVRRTGEIATLFADSGVITLVGLISPYREDRDLVRKRHEEQNIPFYEIFLDVPVDELKKRDPKGQYARVESGELRHFTCIDDPYEEPLKPEIVLKTHELAIEESADLLFRRLERDGILEGAPKVSPPGLPNPDGDLVVDLHVPKELKAEREAEAATLPQVLITDVDLNWLQTIGEGWAAPLRGFMREGTLLETLHFNSILVDPFNLTGNANRHEMQTDFAEFSDRQAPSRVSMSVPITLSCTSFTKEHIESSDKGAVALVTQMGERVAILRNPEIYANRKEEIVTRMFGVIDMDHPYINHIYSGGDYLIGGEVELLDRIKYNDGLDKWRKTAKELSDEFAAKGADTVYAFQTRNPTHAGHAYLMRSAGEDLRAKGFQNPVLWLSPLGGWTKSDDVPLDVRVKQHEKVLDAGTSHPGGLDPDTTVMAIWPAPMVYAGPTEVQFHAKSRRSAGASYFVVGRDPAGMKGSPNAVGHPDDDLYDGDHGRYVLQNSPGIGDMKMLSFVKVMYDITDNVMKIPDDSRMDDFISISGSKMRLLARNGASPCSPTDIPNDLVEANCVPSGFMVPEGWKGVVDYYKNVDASDRWIPWSRPRVEPNADPHTKHEGQFGTTSFKLEHKEYDSLWHDIPMKPSGSEEGIINLVTEIPMRVTAKMEVMKAVKGNPIMQDTNKDGSPRYYSYGTPFFNYGYIPQTWEDPNMISPEGNHADNDPLDVMEVGVDALAMGSITPCRVLGSLELIDEGETDHKIICIALSDPDASKIHSMEDLDRVKPGHTARLLDWLKRYKTSDGKPENALAQDFPTTIQEANEIIAETHERWRKLCGRGDYDKHANVPGAEGFALDAVSCRGE
uniref:Inorganic diphosphatase n=1 Tax=Odontella aurita TaxID=265563 RepID=A0A7S4HZ83_9STRA|mmetsp:Transcript_17517/g.51106  ORF Transcript_17517/g.51106 Transcript_17517/m.51106 type:complete len:1112 (+) Transcript_17517:167-3502(+)